MVSHIGVVPYLYLAVAIVSEVIATSALKQTEGFTRAWPTVITLVGYLIAFFCLSMTLKSVPTGVAYAIWSGVGIVLVSLVAWLLNNQKLDLPAVLGMALIIAGVIVMQLFSKVAAH